MSNLSEYEKKRLANVAERNKLLLSLDVSSSVNSLKAVAPKQVSAEVAPKRARKSFEPVLRREPSRRLQNKPPVNYKEGAPGVEKSEEQDETPEEEIKDERTLDKYVMRWEEESLDGSFFLKTQAPQDHADICLKTCSVKDLCSQLGSMSLIEPLPKLVPERVQSLAVHSSPKLRLILTGGARGSIGFWNIDSNHTAFFNPHKASVNCLINSSFFHEKFYSVSFDGTVLCGEIERGVFTNIHAEDFNERINHLTWANEVDANTLLIAHGNGSVGTLDLREKKVHWNKCFERSCRTVQHHPLKKNYFLASSGAGQCKIWDLNNLKNEVVDLKHSKGLTCAFFSSSGERVLTTSNDDFMNIFEVDLGKASARRAAKAPHNNHTGRWLSVFKAKWLPGRDDVWITGSLLQPRRLQLFSYEGKLLSELRHDLMATVCPVIDIHPSLRLIAGGNSSGRVHVFSKAS